MPELPEVETVRRGLLPVLEGQVLSAVEVRRSDLRKPLPAGFAGALTGRRVERLGRRAKYLLGHLDDGMVWITHLGMSGRIRIFEDEVPAFEKHDHVCLTTESGAAIRYNDPRRFGLMDLCPTEEIGDHPFFADLGPEPLGNEFSGPVLAERLVGKRTPIKAALLDQKVVSGLGNIYVCEVLFRAGISPFRLAVDVGEERAERLVTAVKEVLAEAIAAGGSSLKDHRQPSGELGYFQHAFAVYDREGEPCPGCDCDGVVQRAVQSGRSTFYCKKRQR